MASQSIFFVVVLTYIPSILSLHYKCGIFFVVTLGLSNWYCDIKNALEFDYVDLLSKIMASDSKKKNERKRYTNRGNSMVISLNIVNREAPKNRRNEKQVEKD